MISEDELKELQKMTAATLEAIRVLSNTYPMFDEHEIYHLIRYAHEQRRSVGYQVWLMKQVV